MDHIFEHEIELYPPETFQTLLEHEVNMSRRYGKPLTLIHLIVEAEPSNPQTQHSAEVFTINVLNLQVRETDIPSKKENEFRVLMPSTDEIGGRVVCERLEKLFNVERQTYDRVSFKLSTYIGMATLPGDDSLTSMQLMRNAFQALQYARAEHTTKAVVFSDIKS